MVFVAREPRDLARFANVSGVLAVPSHPFTTSKPPSSPPPASAAPLPGSSPPRALRPSSPTAPPSAGTGTVQLIEKAGGPARYHRCNVAVESDAQAFVDYAVIARSMGSLLSRREAREATCSRDFRLDGAGSTCFSRRRPSVSVPV